MNEFLKINRHMPSSEHRAWPRRLTFGEGKVWEAEVNWTLWPNALYSDEPQGTEDRRGPSLRVEKPGLCLCPARAKMPWASLPLGAPYLFHEGLSPKASQVPSSSHIRLFSFRSPVWSSRSQPKQHCPLVAAGRWHPPTEVVEVVEGRLPVSVPLSLAQVGLQGE